MSLPNVSAYPLQWPPGWPRTAADKRREALFGSVRSERLSRQDTTGQVHHWNARHHRRGKTHTEALRALLNELQRLGARNVVISTNLELRGDGLPYANRRPPADPGVAVYFTLRGDAHHRCMPCDRWDRVPDNLYAVAKCIEAIRGLDRWGAGKMVDAAFSGFKALPAMGSGLPWWEVLELGASSGHTQADVELAFRQLARRHHPDVTGGVVSKEWLALTGARAQALAAVQS